MGKEHLSLHHEPPAPEPATEPGSDFTGSLNPEWEAYCNRINPPEMDPHEDFDAYVQRVKEWVHETLEESLREKAEEFGLSWEDIRLIAGGSGPQESPDLGTEGVLFEYDGRGNPESEERGQMVTIKEAADILGIDPQSVRRIIRKGHAKAEKRRVVIETEVEKVYVSLDDLKEYRRIYGKFTPKRKR